MQEPSLPKLKISKECRTRVADLVEVVLDATKAEVVVKDNPKFADSLRTKAKTHLQEFYAHLPFAGDIEQEQIYLTVSKVQSYLDSAGEQIEKKGLANASYLFAHAAEDTLQILLDTAVDCECREAKAVEKQLGSEAIQRILETEEKLDGQRRPRRWTELTGKEEPPKQQEQVPEYKGEPGIPIKVVPTQTSLHPGKWVLFSKSEGTYFGKQRDTFEEAAEAADKENRRMASYSQPSKK